MNTCKCVLTILKLAKLLLAKGRNMLIKIKKEAEISNEGIFGLTLVTKECLHVFYLIHVKSK